MSIVLDRVVLFFKGLPAKVWPLRWRPLLDCWIDVYLFQLNTAVWRENWNSYSTDYLIVEGRVLRKWGFRFRLYDTAMRRMER